jgi:hypothetical protein
MDPMDTTILLNAKLLPVTDRIGRRRTAHRPARQNPTQLRAYRRALRAAEQAAWEAGAPQTTVSTLPSPVSESDRPLDLLFSVLTLASLFALVFGAKSTAAFGQHWDRLVDFVRLVLG